MRTKLLAIFAFTAIVFTLALSRWTASHYRAVVLAASSPNGSWIPLVAKRTAKVYQESVGKKILISETTGNYLRNRAGSVYQRDLPVLGERRDSIAHVQDLPAREVYEVNYESKTATVIGELGSLRPLQPPTADEFRQQLRSAQSLGTKVISGVECEGYKIAPSETGRTEGEMWVAPSLNFLPVQHRIIDHANGAEILIVLEEIHAGVDPDPGLFSVPEGFTVQQRASIPSGNY